MIALDLAKRKFSAVLRKGPATLRNIVFSRLGIWPVGRIDGADLQGIPTYCISLTRASRRRELMLRQAEGLGLNRFEFVDAVDSRMLDRGDLAARGVIDEERTRQFHTRPLTINEIACSLSHGLAYQRIVEREDPVALVLEDDALFLRRRIARVRLSELPSDFDCVFLNTFLLHDPPRGRVGRSIYSDTSYAGSAAAYLLSLTGARKLASVRRPVIHAADGLLGRSLGQPEGLSHAFRQVGARTTIRAYICHPDAVVNGSVEHYHVSDVQPAR